MLRRWLGVASVAIGIFALVTTEMLPVGLLPAVGTALGVSDGTAGLTVMVPGLVAAIAAPLLTVAGGRLDRRVVLSALVALLAAGNLVSALAPSFSILLAARVVVGVCIGGFWAIAGSLAVRLVPEESVGRATALILGGVATASVIGVPAGTLIGELAGWRTAFAGAGFLAIVVAVALAMLLPRLPATQTIRLGMLPGQLHNPGVRAGILATFLLVTGHFSAYTFVSPILRQVSGIEGGVIGSLLLAYGVAGITGNFVAGTAANRDVRRTLLVIICALSTVMLLMPVLGDGKLGGVALLIAWGLTYGGVSVSLQTWVLKTAPRTLEAANALFVMSFNLSISLGALIGGRVVDGLGTRSVLWLGGTLVLLTAAPIWRARPIA